MTRELLKRYQDILAEIDDLTTCAVDTVQASHTDYPYTMHTVTIEGGDYQASRGRSERLASRKAEKREIECFINTLPNYRIRRIAWLYANGNSWSEIAVKVKFETPGSARQKLLRAIENYNKFCKK